MAGLGGLKVAAVLRAENYERARKFYTEVLGLAEQAPAGTEPTREGWFEAGEGTMISIYERPGMPAPQNTTLAFAVPADQFDSLIKELRSRGVILEDYDIPEIGLRTVDGVADIDGNRAAWFKDSEGNIISVGSM